MLFVAYIRVSTQQQGVSGLGLEAQVASIAAHVRTAGGEIVATYREIESGRVKDRPELARALAHARRVCGSLIVARLDRLARNLVFVGQVLESGVGFVDAANPQANRLTLQILAAVAEEEARLISARTKAALAAARARGVLLGSSRPGHWEGREDSRRRGLDAARIAAAEAARAAAAARIDREAARLARDLRDAGHPLSAIAAALTAAGHVTPRGRTWHPSQVARLLAHA